METIRNNLPVHGIGVVLTAMLFTLFGVTVPWLWSRYGTTEYYRIYGSVVTDKAIYTPCEDVTLTFTRQARSPLRATLDSVLLQVDVNPPIHRDSHTIYDIGLEGGAPTTIISKVPLPCDLAEGKYLINRTLYFEVDGNKKTFNYKSDTFSVQGSGSP